MNVDHPRVPKGLKKNSKGKRRSNDDSLKVVYISSPMKVKTSASRFRSLVQQLTGKNSDITRYMDDNNNHGATDFYDCYDDDQSLAKETSDPYQTYNSSISPYDTPTSSDSLTGSGTGSMDNIFTSQFDGIFSSNSFYDPSELDVLGSFDELL